MYLKVSSEFFGLSRVFGIKLFVKIGLRRESLNKRKKVETVLNKTSLEAYGRNLIHILYQMIVLGRTQQQLVCRLSLSR